MLGRNLVNAARVSGLNIMAPRHSELDLLSKDSVRAWLVEQQPELVIHCAGHVGGIQANIADPLGFLALNSEMGTNLVRVAHEVGVKRLLNVGSSCMYPRAARNPLREDDLLTGPLEPTNEGYALAKILTAKLCEYVARQSMDFCYRTVIPCNLYGRYDHFEPERSHLVPAIIRKVHEARTSGAGRISLWGDGTARREFMFAADAAKIVLAAAQRIEELPQYMNIGLGHDYSVLEYYEAAGRVIEWSGRYEFDLSKPTGMKQKLVDISQQARFGFEATTSLTEGLRQSYQYFLETCCAS